LEIFPKKDCVARDEGIIGIGSTTMPLLTEQNNFADLREEVSKLIDATDDDTLKRLAGIVVTLANRCDLLERQVERLSRGEK